MSEERGLATIRPQKYRGFFPPFVTIEITPDGEAIGIKKSGERLHLCQLPVGYMLESQSAKEIRFKAGPKAQRSMNTATQAPTEKPYLFLDTESTGSDPIKDRIVQFAAVPIDIKGLPVDSWVDLYLNPTIPIPAAATEVHKITDDMVKNQPTFKEVAGDLSLYLSDDVVICGYNVSFDLLLLSQEFGRAGIRWPLRPLQVIDMYKIYVLHERRDLAAAYKFYCGAELTNAHSATVDVSATISIFQAQLQKHPNLQTMTIQELHDFCNYGNKNVDLAGKIVLNDDGIPVYNIGAQKGIPVHQDRRFGEWMLTRDFPYNTKDVVSDILGI